ncbi:MAG: hypothetical protein KF830_16590 [Planctomycetes bacterium]|nr:hypothetical protein [Planctomycetota bacterium]
MPPPPTRGTTPADPVREVGNRYAQFTWQPTVLANTKGAPNVNQTFP